MCILAETDASQAAVNIVIWVLVLVALLIPLAAATLWLRRWVRQDDGPEGGAPFTLHQIQEMRRRGELTEAQYDRLRGDIIAQAKADLNASAKPQKPQGPAKG